MFALKLFKNKVSVPFKLLIKTSYNNFSSHKKEYYRLIEQMKSRQKSKSKENDIELTHLGITSQHFAKFDKNSLLKEQDIFYQLIQNNKQWQSEQLSKDPEFFSKLSSPQKPNFLIITCSDSRITLNEITLTHPGEVFTHRNIGNLALQTDINAQSVLQYGIEILKVKHIIVLGHTDCGAVKACLNSDYHGTVDSWLSGIRSTAEKYHKELIECEHTHLPTRLSELNVKEQVLNICKSETVQRAWSHNQPLFIHGCIFEVETGSLRDLQIRQNSWKEIEDIYKLEFNKL
jgi:carbonic anhydrase